MKKAIFLIFIVCVLAIVYVSIRVETIKICYDIADLYKEKNELYAQKQFALCKLLRSISPEKVEARIALERTNLGFNLPSRVVLVDSSGSKASRLHKRLSWNEMLFGEKEALAEAAD